MSALGDAWQAALAAEQQAVFGYGLLGPHLAPRDRALAYACVLAHETRRDETAIALTAGGLTAADPAADYPALYPVNDAAAARRLAVRLEDDCARAWRVLYLRAASARASRGTPPGLRVDAQGGLTASAVQATRWRAVIAPGRATIPFPGL